VRPATLRALVIFFATGAYVGYIPIAPGTAGSLLGVVIGFLCRPFWSRRPGLFVTAFAVMFSGACYVADEAERLSGRHDDSRIVIDEIFGMVAAMAWLPGRMLWIALAFGLFRLCDILKPWPASLFDKMRGGAGVMLDDLAAGLYANLAAHLIWRIIAAFR